MIDRKRQAVIIFLLLLMLSLGGVLMNTSMWAPFLMSSVMVENPRSIVVSFAASPATLSPLDTSAEVFSVTSNLYEGLVALNQNLVVKPALAGEYGRINERQWWFTLRGNAYFHDGELLTIDDVIHSFNIFKKYSPDVSLLDTIEKIEKVGDESIIITTTNPDVLLLQKIARVGIFPATADLDSLKNHPVGSGPYKLESWQEGRMMVLIRNNRYWGALPDIEKVTIVFGPDKDPLQQILRADHIGIDVGGTLVSSDNPAYVVRMEPMLFNNFVLFNLRNAYLSRKENRKQLADFFQQQAVSFSETSGYDEFVRSSQFITSGVVGYNQNLAMQTVEGEKTYSFPRTSLTLAYDQNNYVLAKWMKSSLAPYGINILLNPMQAGAFAETLKNGGKYDLYLFGWLYSEADACPFFDQVIHTRDKAGHGMYNVMGYSNPEMDNLIHICDSVFDPKQRLNSMQNAIYNVVKKDYVGIPLFEVRRKYVVNKKMDEQIEFPLRLDGTLFYKDFYLKQ